MLTQVARFVNRALLPKFEWVVPTYFSLLTICTPVDLSLLQSVPDKSVKKLTGQFQLYT